MKPHNTNSVNCSYGPRGEGAEIAYTIVDSARGRLLAAGTRRGICFAAMGETDATLVSELRFDYPLASIRVFDPNRIEDKYIGDFADALARYVSGRAEMPSPPIDIRGTAFQFAVWDQLRAIPAGKTRSYSEIARRIGRPRAIRAVGTANGANPVAVVLPCHRVIGANGSLTGYGGGIERKRWLLNHEKTPTLF